MGTLDSKSSCNLGTSVKRNLSQRSHQTPPYPKKRHARVRKEGKRLLEHGYKREGRKATHSRTEKYRDA